MDESPNDLIDLRAYALVLWRRRATVAISAALVVLIAVGLTFVQTPLYRAETELAIEPLRRSADANLTDLILGSATIETERRVITSGAVTEAVIESLGLDTTSAKLLDRVAVTTLRDTRVVTIRVTDPDAQMAAAIANEFTNAYLTVRRQDALDRLLAAREALDEGRQALTDELTEVNNELGRDSLSEEDRITLEAQRDSILTQLGQVSAQQLAADAETDLVRGGGTVLRVAEVPTVPASPRKFRTAILALLLGGMLGVGMAFAREFFDDGVHSEEALQRATGGAPVFGRIPSWTEPTSQVLTLVAPRDHAVEAYRELRANVRFVIGQHGRSSEWEGRRRSRRDGSQRTGRSLLITSSIAGEGKSSTAANLAAVAAKGGARVLLIDADLRKPRQADMFGLPTGTGLSHQLADGGEIADRLVNTGVDGLWVLPAGPPPPNPAELLSSRVMTDLVFELEELFDLVIMDSPPILAVADALELAQLCSATLLVASARTSSQRAVRRAVERLGHIGVVASGGVLNNIDRDSPGNYYTYYQSYEHTEPAPDFQEKVPANPVAAPAPTVPEPESAPQTVPPPPAAATAPPVSPSPFFVTPEHPPAPQMPQSPEFVRPVADQGPRMASRSVQPDDLPPAHAQAVEKLWPDDPLVDDIIVEDRGESSHFVDDKD